MFVELHSERLHCVVPVHRITGIDLKPSPGMFPWCVAIVGLDGGDCLQLDKTCYDQLRDALGDSFRELWK